MWSLIGSEFKYNQHIYSALVLVFFLFTLSALNDFDLLNNDKFGVDYWGGIIAGFLYLFYFILWPIRIKELRERQYVALPIPIKKIAKANTFYIAISIFFSIIYFLVLHIQILSVWQEAAASVAAQLGTFFTVFTSFIFIRELWYLIDRKSNLFRFCILLLAGIYILASLVLIFLFLRQISYNIFGWHFGRIVFYLPVVINLILSYKFFLKRKSYLT